ncbi:MAG: BamA/TamA family outer membrane protein [Chitinophagaceae bacterium]|nr:BamA/TamA family outer membrane protein [Chitinophagaceae bacterium]
MKLNLVTQSLLLFALALLLSACGGSAKLTQGKYSRIKKHPKEKPFVYYNEIQIINDELKPDKRAELTSRLTTQLDDSMQLRVKQSFLVLKKLVEPPVFDSMAAVQSVRNMEIYLKTAGYFYGKVTFDSTLYIHKPNNVTKKEIRVATVFNVTTGPQVKIDSISFIIYDSTRQELTAGLQQLTDRHRSESFLKKGEPFTEDIIRLELERLVELYRNNGYYKFSREQLFADVDSFYLPLLNPLLDPFERIQVLQEAQQWRANPSYDVYIRLKPRADLAAIRPWQLGTVTVYPDYSSATFDTTRYQTLRLENMTIKYKQEKFKPSFIQSHIFLKEGNLYRLSDITKTVNDLDRLGTWQFIKLEPKEQKFPPLITDTAKVNFDFLLVPFRKYSFTADLESVFNQVQQAAVGVAGNLIGFGINLGLRNRNFAKRGIQFTNTARFGVESGIGTFNSGLQAIEYTYSSSLSIPKLVLLGRKSQQFNQKRTYVTTTLSHIDRNINPNNGLYSLDNIVIAAGWQWQIPAKKLNRSTSITVQPFNVEFLRLYDISSGFQLQLDQNDFLRLSFAQGLAMGSLGNIIHTRNLSPYKSIYFRAGVEESGLLHMRAFRTFSSIKKQLFTYVKGDIEFKYTKTNLNKTNWVFRTIIGAGYNTSDTASMPFFKQFTGGGPNSMRAWPLRSIGPGSRPLDPRGSRGQFFSRSGDFIFEANAEYRYNIYTVIPNTFVIRGALFTDVGNVWNFRNSSNIGNDTVVLKLKEFYRELGVSAGTGVRFDFIGLFILRLDFGLRFKNPSKPFSEKGNGWRVPDVTWRHIFSSGELNKQWRYENFNFSLGINYPF